MSNAEKIRELKHLDGLIALLQQRATVLREEIGEVSTSSNSRQKGLSPKDRASLTAELRQQYFK